MIKYSTSGKGSLVSEAIVLKGMETREEEGRRKIRSINDIRHILGRRKSSEDARMGCDITQTS